MTEKILLSFLPFLFLLIVTLFAGRKWFKQQTRDNTWFFAFMILLSVALYSVVVLDISISGSNLTVEMKKARDDVLATKQEVGEIGKLIFKAAFVLSEGSQRFGGVPPEHEAKLKEYAREMSKLTNQNNDELMDEIEKTLQELDKLINRRNTSGIKQTH
ncbi:MAG: hypothetical protein AABY87_04660 [bacterium]